MSNEQTNEQTHASLREVMTNPMFGERDTVAEAYEYAVALLKASSADHVTAYTALHVLMNTIAKNMPKTYHAKFNGHYPVGACAIVLAKDRNEAFTKIYDAICKEGLGEANHQYPLNAVKMLDEESDDALILLNGDY